MLLGFETPEKCFNLAVNVEMCTVFTIGLNVRQ